MLEYGETHGILVNKSHAAAYAAISMQTAYLKANYLHEFAAGLLTSVMDNSVKLMKYIGICRKAGITVLPLDVHFSETSFSLEGEKLRFGLSAIKGIGKEAAKKIVEENKKEHYKSLPDFITRNPELNKKGFEMLAKAGALDTFGYNRGTIVDNINSVVSEIRKKKKNSDNSQINLFDFFGVEEPEVQVEIHECPELEPIIKCRYEKEATGLYLSEHPAACIEAIAKLNGAIDIQDITCENSQIGNRQTVSVYGLVTEVQRKITKKGNQMVIVTLEDETGTISLLLFENTIEKYMHLFDKDSLLFVTGKAKVEESDSSITVQSISVLKEVPQVLWLITNSSTLGNIEKLAASFAKHNPGIGDYLYVASTSSKQKKPIGQIAISPDIITKARIQFGAENVMVTESKNRKNA